LWGAGDAGLLRTAIASTFRAKADGGESVYLCGQSLGLQPKSVRAYIEQELKDWELLGVDGHFARGIRG
jgi:kynureninase